MKRVKYVVTIVPYSKVTMTGAFIGEALEVKKKKSINMKKAIHVIKHVIFDIGHRNTAYHGNIENEEQAGHKDIRLFI